MTQPNPVGYRPSPAELRERMDRPDWPPRALACKFAAKGKCQLCGRKFPYPFLGLHAHHNTYVRLGNEDPTDLIALCGSCHAHVTWRMRHGDLLHIRAKELLGLVQAQAPRLGQVHEFYAQHIKGLGATLAEMEEGLTLLIAATDTWREWQERGAA